MRDSSGKISRKQKIIGVLAVMVMLFICGCEDFFAQKPTEVQSRSIIRELSQIREVPDINRPIPEIYLAEPKIMEVNDCAMLFYFTKQHTVDKLSGLITEQLGYTVSQSPATNQLIVKCPTVDAAKATIKFLNEVDVPPIQIKIDCLISKIYADKTLDWETTIEISNFLSENIKIGGTARAFGADVAELVEEGAILPAFPGASLRSIGRAKMGLKVGYLSDSSDFLAVVDMLESKGYLKILMHPTLEVVNGRKAKISTSERVPVPKEVITKQLLPYMTTDYEEIIDSLEITPHAFADGSIGLETKAQISSKNIPEGVKQISILTKREINIEENRIKPGDSLVIGGIRKSEEFSVVRGVPLLKDIPLLGILFSGKDFEERATETIFIITPSISSGGMPHKEMIEVVKRKHAPPSPEGLEETILDPCDFKARKMEQ
jgi:type II secretory pathway component GspD/PulD (secretin)